MSVNAEDRRMRELRAFVDNFETVVANLRPDAPVPSVGVKGTDQTGTVFCVVDVRGKLVQVGLTDGWWDALGPTRIGGAVLDAWRFAKYKASLAWLVLDKHGRTPARARLATPFAAQPLEELPAYDDPNFLGVLARKADRAMTILEQAERFHREISSPERREVYGPRGLFRVIVSGLEIVGAELVEQGLQRPDAKAVAEDARAALLATVPSAHLAQRRDWGDR